MATFKSGEPLVKIKQRHNFPLLFGLVAGGQKRIAVMEGKADQLLAAGNDFGIAQSTCFRQGKGVIAGIFYQMHHLFQLVTGLTRLTIQPLGQNHRQQRWICPECPSNRSKICPGRPRSNQSITFQYQGIAHHLNQVLMGNRDVTGTQQRNALGAGLLNAGKFL